MGKRGPKSVYSEAQWDWVAERFREGYTLQALADFLGMHRQNVHRYVAGARWELPPLEERRKEFNSIGEE